MFDGMAGRKKISILCLLPLVPSFFGLPPAEASPILSATRTFLAGAAIDGLLVVDVDGAAPVVHGPYLATELGNLLALERLEDQQALLALDAVNLHRVELADPLAPAISATLPLPFAPKTLVAGGPGDYSLLLGVDRQLAVIDHRTLTVRATFTTATRRDRGTLSPDGRTLVTFNSSMRKNFISSFDVQLGSGAETELFSSLASADTWAFFSPDGRTLGILQNTYFFDLHGPAYHSPLLDLYEKTGPAQYAGRDILFLGSDAIHGHVHGRGGGQLFFAQNAGIDPWAPTENRLKRLLATGPGQLASAPDVVLTEAGVGYSTIARSAGGRLIYVATGEYQQEGGATIAKLHVYDPAAETHQTFPLAAGLGTFYAFETGAEIFADGFESGHLGAWNPSDLQ